MHLASLCGCGRISIGYNFPFYLPQIYDKMLVFPKTLMYVGVCMYNVGEIVGVNLTSRCGECVSTCAYMYMYMRV